jgi:prepilin-type N-terminal cleavage/methylation domain-containing protein
MNQPGSLISTSRLGRSERAEPARCLRSRLTRPESPGDGFTLVEMLVVIGIIAILVALLLPVLGSGKSRGQQVYCVNNFHQLTLSWKMYADENGGKLVPIFYFWRGGVNTNAWVRGSMNDDTKIYPAVDPGRRDSTNENGIKLGSLYQYNRSVGVYHCPADTSSVDGARRVRSYSLNGWMGGTWVAGQSNYMVFRRDTEIVNPSPSKAWVFIDEHERSINDGWFAVDMKGDRGLLDAPATRHNNSYALSFADSHSEIWKLRDSRSVNWKALPISNNPLNPDWQRLRESSTSLRPGFAP